MGRHQVVPTTPHTISRILNCRSALLQKPHPAHLSIPEAVGIAEDLGVERTWLTHLTHRARHAELAASLPSHVQPASDGLVIEIEP